MKIFHDPSIDYVSIDFKDEVEAKSYFQEGIIIREDKNGNVIGIDITDSSQFFAGESTISLKEACRLIGISESTMRRKIKRGQVPFTKKSDRKYRFKKSDVFKLKE